MFIQTYSTTYLYRLRYLLSFVELETVLSSTEPSSSDICSRPVNAMILREIASSSLSRKLLINTLKFVIYSLEMLVIPGVQVAGAAYTRLIF